MFILLLLYGSAYATSGCMVRGLQDSEPEYVAWIKEFVNLRASDKDSALPLMRIKDYYDALPANEKEEVNSKMIEIVSGYVRSGHTVETMAMIDLYDFLADKNDAKRPDLYFIRGNIYAERQDTVMLKETIARIESCNGKQMYLDKLNDYLMQIRRFVPADQGLDGYWVSDIVQPRDFLDGSEQPYFRINICSNIDSTSFIIIKDSPFARDVMARVQSSSIFDLRDRAQISQLVIPYSKDSLYVVWASERLKNYDAEIIGAVRGTIGTSAATIEGTLSQRHKYSKDDYFAGSILTSIGEAGINSLIDNMFTPTKKTYTLEMRLKKINNYKLQGVAIYRYSKNKADGRSKYIEWTDPITLYKWDKESGIVFCDDSFDPVPQENIDVKRIKKDKTSYFAKCRSIFKHSFHPFVYKRSYNSEQLKQLIIYNEKQWKEENPYGTSVISVPEDTCIYLYSGIEYSEIPAELKEKKKCSNGIFVTKVKESSPAYVAGIKNGDIILGIDGKSVKDIREFNDLFYKKNIGDIAVFDILRKKNIQVKTKLSYAFRKKQ